MNKQVTSKWDTGQDGEPRKGILVHRYSGATGYMVCVRWDDGEVTYDDASSVIVQTKQRRR